MTIRTFWTIFIKILGIWILLDSITVIPQFFSTLFFSVPTDPSQGLALSSALVILTLGIYLLILRLFVFKTAWLIDKLNLSKGFEEEKIDLNVQLSTVLRVSTIVIGGLMFVDSLPQLCKEIFIFFQQNTIFRESPTIAWIIYYSVKTYLGYLLMTKNKLVVEFINKQSNS